MNVITRQVYYFEDLELGMEASFAKTVSEADIAAFAEVTGDKNPVHLDADYAAKTIFKEPHRPRHADGRLHLGRVRHGAAGTGRHLRLADPELPRSRARSATGSWPRCG